MAIKISQLPQEDNLEADDVLPVVQAGTTFKATVAAIVGVFLPTALGPSDTGKMAYVDGAAGEYVLTAAPTATGQTMVWNGTAWAPGALNLSDGDAVSTTIPTPAGGDVNKMLYVSGAGALVLTSTVKTDGTYLSTGADPAASGAFRLSAGDSVSIKLTNGTTVPAVWQSGSALVYGANNASLTSMQFNLGTGGTFSLGIAGGTEYAWDANTFAGNQNSLSGWSFLALSTLPATNSQVRLSPHATGGVGVASRNAAGTQNIDLLTCNADAVIVGGDAQNTGMHLRVASGMSVFVIVNGTTEYTLDATRLNLASGNVLQFAVTTTAGLINTANNVNLWSSVTAGASALNIFRWTSGDHINIGDQSAALVEGVDTYMSATGQAEWRTNGNLDMALNSTNLQINTAIKWGGGTTAAAGLNRTANNVSFWQAKHSDGTNDAVLLGFNSANRLEIGASTFVANMRFDVATGGAFDVRVNGGLEYTLDASALYMSTNNLQWDSTSAPALMMINSQSTATETTIRVIEVRGQDKSGNTSTVAGTARMRAGNATGAGGTHAGGALELLMGSATGGSGTRTAGYTWLGIGTGATRDGNIYIGKTNPSAYNWQSMGGGIAIEAATTAPTGNPASGTVFLWLEGDILKYRKPDGTTVELN